MASVEGLSKEGFWAGGLPDLLSRGTGCPRWGRPSGRQPSSVAPLGSASAAQGCFAPSLFGERSHQATAYERGEQVCPVVPTQDMKGHSNPRAAWELLPDFTADWSRHLPCPFPSWGSQGPSLMQSVWKALSLGSVVVRRPPVCGDSCMGWFWGLIK
jgi:hypothetical protein